MGDSSCGICLLGWVVSGCPVRAVQQLRLSSLVGACRWQLCARVGGVGLGELVQQLHLHMCLDIRRAAAGAGLYNN